MQPLYVDRVLSMTDSKTMNNGERLYRQVADKMILLIESGEYPTGSRLPAERELAEKFGVSRPTIREAVIALEAKGRVAVKTGSGVYVLEKIEKIEGLGQEVSPFELIETRVFIEGESAALAAALITDDQLVALKEALGEMAMDSPEGGTISSEADRKFHSIISEATNNRVFALMIRQLWDVQEKLDNIRVAHQAVCMQDMRQRLAEHTAIYNALENRDPNAARAAMRNHFSRTLTALHETTEEEAVKEVRRKVSQMRERFSFERMVDSKSEAGLNNFPVRNS